MNRPSSSSAASDGWQKILRFNGLKVDRGRVRRAYKAYRRENDIPERCDNEDCRFHKDPLVWNGKPLKPILDHRDGNRFDNSPNNLRYLCPHCESQLPTRGGGNRGRVVDITEYGYTLNNPDGSRIVAATAGAVRASSARAVGGAIRTP